MHEGLGPSLHRAALTKTKQPDRTCEVSHKPTTIGTVSCNSTTERMRKQAYCLYSMTAYITCVFCMTVDIQEFAFDKLRCINAASSNLRSICQKEQSSGAVNAVRKTDLRQQMERKVDKNAECARLRSVQDRCDRSECDGIQSVKERCDRSVNAALP